MTNEVFHHAVKWNWLMLLLITADPVLKKTMFHVLVDKISSELQETLNLIAFLLDKLFNFFFQLIQLIHQWRNNCK